MDNKENLINELRECADALVKMANDESFMSKQASTFEVPASSERADYMTGVMQGLGLE